MTRVKHHKARRGAMTLASAVVAAAAATARFLDAPPAVPDEHPYTLARMQDTTLAVYAEFEPRAGRDPLGQDAKS